MWARMESLVVTYHTPSTYFTLFFAYAWNSLLRIYRSSFLSLHHCIVSMVPLNAHQNTYSLSFKT